jgi:hypothetical protein
VPFHRESSNAMLTMSFWYLLLGAAVIITVFIVWDPFRWNSQGPEIRTIRLRGRNIQNESFDYIWERALADLAPVRNFFNASKLKSKPTVGLENWDALTAVHFMKDAGTGLGSSARTILQKMTAIGLVQASEELEAHLVGEVDGLKEDAVNSIDNAIEDIYLGVEEKKATRVFDAIARLMFSSRENRGVKLLSSQRRPKLRAFRNELDLMINDHFIGGKTRVLDAFIHRWSLKSIDEQDIYIYMLISFLDTYQVKLGPLAKSLSLVGSLSTIRDQRRYGEQVVKELRAFGVAYKNSDTLRMFKVMAGLNEIVNEQ